MAAVTHPDIASLVDPLFAFGEKRVNKEIKQPSLRLAEERVIQRSADRVSNRRYAIVGSVASK